MKVLAFTLQVVALTSALFDTVSGECDGTQTDDVVTALDFFGSTVTTNTLHETGGELRYGSEYTQAYQYL
jgi:hypothetical protein